MMSSPSLWFSGHISDSLFRRSATAITRLLDFPPTHQIILGNSLEQAREGVLPSKRDVNESSASEGALSIDAWMELFYASLLDQDPAKLAQRLEKVRRRGKNLKLRRTASRSERQILRAALKAIEDLEQRPGAEERNTL
jgi:hypothetical protein